MLQRQWRDQPTELRGLYEMVGDRELLAELDRQIMGQSETVRTDF